MVKYKNFGNGGQTIGSFSFSSQASQHSTKTTRTGKSSSKSHRRDERSPSITRRESEEFEDECRDEDGSRFDPRILPNDSTEEDIKEGEAESLYDMISYNGVTDEHSTSVCASYSYSVGETDSSAGFSDPPHSSPNGRRAKLSYMGYVPMSPNTAAMMAMKEMREHSHTHRHRNVNNDVNNNNDSGHTAGEGTTTTGSTFPSIKVDDTSTSRRRQRHYDDESQSEQRQPAGSPSVATDDCSSQGVAENITEYITAGQKRFLEEQKKLQSKNKDSTAVTSSSVADQTQNSRVEDATVATSIASSVMPNSCTGHPAMMNQGRPYQQQQQQRKPNGQYLKPNNEKSNNKDFFPLSPIVASPRSDHQPHTPSKVGAEAWPDNASLGLSPLTAGISAHGMMPPTLNHPSPMMQQQWDPNRGLYQQQFGYQQQQPIQNYPNHQLHMYPYGAGGNHQQNASQQQQQPVQQQQAFRSGFFPRNPVLARQLQAFHQYHNQQQQQQEQEQREQPAPTSQSPSSRSPEEPQGSQPTQAPRAHHSFQPISKDNGEIQSSQQSKGDSSSTDHQPFLICGPEGPRLMENVKFVTPAPIRSSSNSASVSSHSRAYGISYSGGGLGMSCAQHPAGMKCQSYIASLIDTCGAIVTHGYHIDNRKSSSKEKRAKFGKVAEDSIAGLAPSDHGKEEKEDNGIGGIGSIGSGLNDAFAANAKKILNAGNSMMSTLPKDFQNLAQSAAYHNVFDTFQKFSPMSPMRSQDDSTVLSDDPDEVEAAKEAREISMSPVSAQREHFKKLRRRRNRATESPIRRSISEGNPALSPSSPKAENFKERYSRNLHTKLHHEKLEKANGGVDTREPEEIKEESRTISKASSKDPAGSKDDDSNYSWATPMSREEKPDPSPGTGSSDSLEEVLGEHVSEDVVMSTSSGMSDSLVGSDVDEEEPQLDCMMNESLSDDERQELDDGEDHLLLDSYDHNEFPHTPLDVIEEGSEDEDTTVNPASVIGAEAPMDEQVTDTTDELSLDGLSVEKSGFRTSMKSMIGIVRMLFVSMLLFQCGTVICLWDQIADQIRTLDGGAEMLSNAEQFVSDLKAGSVSLVTTAQNAINVDKIDIAVGDIFSEIESRTTELMGTANEFLAGFSSPSMSPEEAEMKLFHQLLDEAFGDDDVLRREESEDETYYEDAVESLSSEE